MVEEIEVPLEDAQESTMHHAAHSHERWISWVALSSALLAAAAAITSLLAGHDANEAMIEQIQASNHWSYYQAKSIKASVATTKIDLFSAVGKPVAAADQKKLDGYHRQMAEIQGQAEERQQSAEAHMLRHQVYARGVTMFQVAIAVAAISALTRKRRFWLVGLGFGAVGAAFLVQGLLMQAG
jgi:Domain of unknown function (DUF4337)